MRAAALPPRRRPARLLRGLFRVLLLLLVALAGIWWAARPAAPGPFYEHATPVPDRPGALLRHEAFSQDVPSGARGWRILYATTRADGTPAIASAIVVAPAQAAGARPVIAWAHGTTGLARGCAPPVMGKPFANVPAFDRIVPEGWVYVATDYVGLGTPGPHAYLVGDEAARAVLDAVRAARHLAGLALDGRLVVWGHSQGGNSALWTASRARQYAPELDLLGVAAQAPASDLAALVVATRGSLFGKIVSSYLIKAYAAAYPEIAATAYVRPGIGLLVDDIAARCVGGWPMLVSAFGAQLLPGDGVFATDPAAGPLGRRLAENTPQAAIPMPVFIAQGAVDDLVLPDIQHRYVAARCGAGQVVDYRVYRGLDHLSLVAPASPLVGDLVAWTRDRFAGRPAPAACLRAER